MAEQKSLANDLFEDMGRKVAEASGQQEEDDSRVVDEIESLCMNCHENGTTRLLLTRIPFFREIVIMSFECPHCHFRNSEIQPAGEIQQRGIKYTVRVDNADDLSKQVVKSDTAVFRVEEIDLEIPPGSGSEAGREAREDARGRTADPEGHRHTQGDGGWRAGAVQGHN
ncbi:hypothetical protein OPT61_g9706 [Boeremia exigua]|uniref:Uncharacterized protein n=1 Tax=Boeremia exigua TaxID=749465 RepID=A0ACC2HSZ2_9PLEO|nr:hypothetical protein OPT61_g9706 [Boeremia exigua]